MHPAAPPSVNHEYMTQKLHILVVEDNFGDFILIEQMLLEIRDFQKDILHVTTLAEATKRMEEQHCDVVLLDLSLPDSYGIDSFHRLSKLFPQTPVIIMSGLNDTRFANEAVKQGAQEYLVKGEFEERLLAKSISYSIERKASMEFSVKVKKRIACSLKITLFRCTSVRKIRYRLWELTNRQ